MGARSFLSSLLGKIAVDASFFFMSTQVFNDSLQLCCSGSQGLPLLTQNPSTHDSVPLQKLPSSHSSGVLHAIGIVVVVDTPPVVVVVLEPEAVVVVVEVVVEPFIFVLI